MLGNRNLTSFSIGNCAQRSARLLFAAFEIPDRDSIHAIERGQRSAILGERHCAKFNLVAVSRSPLFPSSTDIPNGQGISATGFLLMAQGN